jgi:DNA-binding NarL/FixJ family response regulator
MMNGRTLKVLTTLAGVLAVGEDASLSHKTVQNHVSRILDKLQAADRTQAALRARGIPPTAR